MAQSVTAAFHDVTTGNNVVPCSSGWDCSNGSFGYNAASGYDLVTGLGSPDGFTFVTGSTNRTVNTSVGVAASPATLNGSGSSVITATVTAAGSAAVPTGTVTFFAGDTSLGTTALVNSGGSATATINVSASQLTAGSNVITAQFSGSSGFNASTASATLTVNIAAAAITASIGPSPVFQHRPDADGFSWFYTVTLTEVAGAAATLTEFSMNGVSNAAQIATLFGSSSIPARGKLSAAMRAKDVSAPTSVRFHFSGTDAGGRQWSQDVSVLFYGFSKDYTTQPVCPADGGNCAEEQ